MNMKKVGDECRRESKTAQGEPAFLNMIFGSISDVCAESTNEHRGEEGVPKRRACASSAPRLKVWVSEKAGHNMKGWRWRRWRATSQVEEEAEEQEARKKKEKKKRVPQSGRGIT